MGVRSFAMLRMTAEGFRMTPLCQRKKTTMEERKYGQRGYREYEKGQPAKPTQPSKPTESSGPRAPAMPQARTVSRCVDCGTAFPPLTDSLVKCPKCGAALHSCRQCAHFDPGQHFECAQPITERITNKSATNACTF